MSVNPQLMIARKGFPADDLKGLVAWMKANPGKATFVDQNAAAKLTGILMMQATGTTVQFIPYRGAGPAMQAMLGGQVDLMVVQAAVTLPQARAGHGQDPRQPLARALARGPGHPDLRRERHSGPLRLGLVRPVRAAGRRRRRSSRS